MIEKSDFFDRVRAVFEINGLSRVADDEKIEKFRLLTEIMQSAGEKMNLTAIKDEEEIIEKHYADSLLILTEQIAPGASLCDVGCGGGFPSFPLAIARPDLEITAIDSTAKKIRYINETAEKIGVKNLKAYCARAEEAAASAPPASLDKEIAALKMRERFDVVTARAVAALPVLCELCLPFVKVGGIFVAMKARSAEEELNSSENAVKELGGETESVKKLTLRTTGKTENGDMERTMIIVRKKEHTPSNYPRTFAAIKKKPL